METIEVEVSAVDVARAVTLALPRSPIWIRRDGLERSLDMPLAALHSLAQTIAERSGIIRVRVTYDTHQHAKRVQYGFELAGE